MPNSIEKPTRRATIQSVDRAARILKVLASGPRRLGVSEIADRLGLDAADGARLAADAPGAWLRRAGPRLGQVPARSGPAAARQLLSGPQRAAVAIARPRRAARDARRRRRSRRRDARRERRHRPPRVPARLDAADPRGRRRASSACERARQGDARVSRPTRACRPARRAAPAADQPDADAGGAARRSSSEVRERGFAPRAATRRSSASRASPRRSSTTPATPSVRSGSSATPSGSCRAVPGQAADRGRDRGGARRLARARRHPLARIHSGAVSGAPPDRDDRGLRLGPGRFPRRAAMPPTCSCSPTSASAAASGGR